MATLNERTAVIVVDTQNDFALREGKLSVTNGESVIEPINRVTRAARAAGSLVVFTRDWHPKETPHFELWPEHCVNNTDGAELHKDLEVEPTDFVVNKGQGQTDGYSGFEAITQEDQPRQLEELLRDRGVTAVIIGGLATDYCVRATTIDAAKRGFQTMVLADAVEAVNLQPQDGDAALAEMQQAGAELTTTREVLGG